MSLETTPINSPEASGVEAALKLVFDAMRNDKINVGNILNVLKNPTYKTVDDLQGIALMFITASGIMQKELDNPVLVDDRQNVVQAVTDENEEALRKYPMLDKLVYGVKATGIHVRASNTGRSLWPWIEKLQEANLVDKNWKKNVKNYFTAVEVVQLAELRANCHIQPPSGDGDSDEDDNDNKGEDKRLKAY